MDALGPERLAGDRRRQRRVDPARDADDDILEPVLLDVVAQAELEPEPHLLEVVEHRRDLRLHRLSGRCAGCRCGRPATSGAASRSLSSERRRTSRSRRPTRLLGLDVDDEQRLLEPRRAREHLALVVEHDRVPVEDELVLPADGVDEGDVADVVARAGRKHLLSLALLADVERRRGDVDEELRAREREVGRGRAGLPDVLADGRPDQGVAVLEQEEVAPRREVAMLVEDAVVGEEALAVDRLHLAAGADGAGVVEVAVEVRDCRRTRRCRRAPPWRPGRASAPLRGRSSGAGAGLPADSR